MRRGLGAAGLYFLLILGAAVTLVPLVWMAAASFMPAGEANTFPPHFWPSDFTLEHYRALFTRLDVARYFLNSTLLALSVTAISLLVNAMAGYAFAKLRFRGRDRLFRGMLAALVIPVQVAMLPLFLLLEQLGLVNTYWGVIVPGMASIFGIFLVRQYALSVPDDLLDAARIDGASEFRIFAQVVMPLCRPALAALGIFTFTYQWDDFFWPLVIISSEELRTLPLGLALFVTRNRTAWDLLMAGSVITTVPVLLVFLLFQRHFIRGIAVTGMK